MATSYGESEAQVASLFTATKPLISSTENQYGIITDLISAREINGNENYFLRRNQLDP